MKEMAVKNRHRLKRKKSQRMVEQLKDLYGLQEEFSDLELGTTAEGLEVVICKNTIIAFDQDGQTYLTLRGVLLLKPARSFVTVDMGAVKFLYNGADVMAPGIVDADPGIEEGAPVWVRDEKNLKPLAVGRALMDGTRMKIENGGKAIKTLHYISDPIWQKEL
jgi:PUA domain protein